MKMPIKWHPDTATLMSFAAGSLSEPLAAVVAAHADLCEECRSEIARMEAIGGALLLGSSREENERALQVPPLPDDETGGRDRIGSREVMKDRSDGLPSPIARIYGLTLETIPWKRLAPGIWHHRLPLTNKSAGDLRLLRIDAGRTMPEHGHGGSEVTLVLQGSYSDETGSYGRGDVQDLDGTTEHTPIANADTGCICLIASEHPARFKSVIARIMQPWTGM